MNAKCMDIPPSPRKQPRQDRSRQKVDRLLGSCKKILLEHGESALNVLVLEHVSGVMAGSIYQYYPSLDALVGALFEREFDEFVRESTYLLKQRQGYGVRALMEFIVERSEVWRQRMKTLNPGFYSKYCLYFDCSNPTSGLYSIEHFSRHYFVPALVREYALLPSDALESMALQTLRILTDTFGRMVRENPEKMIDAECQWQLVQTGVALIHTAIERSRMILYRTVAH